MLAAGSWTASLLFPLNLQLPILITDILKVAALYIEAAIFFFFNYCYKYLCDSAVLSHLTLKGHQMHCVCARARACVCALYVYLHTFFSPLICAEANMQMKHGWRTRKKKRIVFKIY